MPNALRRLLVLTGALLLATPTPAAQGDLPALRVLASDNNEPFNFFRQGQFVGLGVDVAQELGKRLGIVINVEPLPWARALASARSQPNTLLLTVARTPEREAWFHWIGPIAEREVWLWKLTSRKDILVKTLEDAKRYKIGDITNNASVDFLKRAGFEAGSNLDVSMHDVDIGRKMKIGRVDLVPMNPYSIAAFARESEIPLRQLQPVLLLTREGGYFLGLNTASDNDLHDRLDSTFQSIVQDNTLQRLLARWRPKMKFGPDAP